MESYALAYVCRQRKIPFHSYKWASDDGTPSDWLENCKIGFDNFKQLLLDKIGYIAFLFKNCFLMGGILLLLPCCINGLSGHGLSDHRGIGSVGSPDYWVTPNLLLL